MKNSNHKPNLYLLIFFSLIFYSNILWANDFSENKYSDKNQYLFIDTEKGQIIVKLFDKQVPNTVATLEKIIGQGIFDDSLNKEKNVNGDIKTKKKIIVNHIKPSIEITTTSLTEQEILIPNEINAVSLGIDKIRVDSYGEAMDILQMEILKYYMKNKKGNHLSDLLKQWVDKWHTTYKADFLVGVTRMEINEALGHFYSDTIVSSPVIRGSVILKLKKPGYSLTRLTISLIDRPELNGKRMVIGKVIKGLDLADKISLFPSSGLNIKRKRPDNPPLIKRIQICNGE